MLIPVNGQDILFQDQLGNTGNDVGPADGHEGEGLGEWEENWQLPDISEQRDAPENLLF